MTKLLIVVDMQNDFIDGSLGSEAAQKIIPNVAKKIADWEDAIIVTMDTHFAHKYMDTNEGRHLPVMHCIYETKGWEINPNIEEQLEKRDPQTCTWGKNYFGDYHLGEFVKCQGFDYIEICGLCTDICVISNALILKSYLPEATIIVDAACCAGTSEHAHKSALEVMKNCHIDIINED